MIRFSVRARVVAMGAIAAVAFLLIVLANTLIADRVARQVGVIHGRYIPRVELAPKLDGELERLRRGFQDAVVAKDAGALAATRELKSRLLEQLAVSRGAVDPAEETALRSALEEYYSAAYDVSRRLMASETDEALVDAIGAMQRKQSRVAGVIKGVTSLDRRALAEAFADVKRAEATGWKLGLAISMACLVAATLLVGWLGRGLFRSLAELATGLRRFGEGSFAQPIRVIRRDEVGDAAHHVNQMAASLERLDRGQRESQNALKIANRELESFTYSVAHDLRAPLRAVVGFSQMLMDTHKDKLDADGQELVSDIVRGGRKMSSLIEALLSLARVTKSELKPQRVDLSKIVREEGNQLVAAQPARSVDLVVEDNVQADVDVPLARALVHSLLGNSWKFTSKAPAPRIEFGVTENDGARAYFVRDNGAGFDMAYASKLFGPFQRLHSETDYPGIGIGLAIVQRIVHRHGGQIWAEGSVHRGATFYFTLRTGSTDTTK